jgi:phosphatidylinositol alpha 1,6-mannosyltransferase
MEAAASGIASIATDSGAPREVVDDGVTGLLVPPGAPDALASAIATLYRSPELLAEMSDAALARSAGFTWDRSIDTLEGVLKEAVAEGPTGRDARR